MDGDGDSDSDGDGDGDACGGAISGVEGVHCHMYVSGTNIPELLF